AGAEKVGVQLQAVDVHVDQLHRAFETARDSRAQAIFFLGDSVLTTAATQIAGLADAFGMVAMYSDRRLVDAGGLMSYGVYPYGFWRDAADYVDRILRGATPADLPVELPTRFEFVLNTRAAQRLGLKLRAQVIEQVTDWIR